MVGNYVLRFGGIFLAKGYLFNWLGAQDFILSLYYHDSIHGLINSNLYNFFLSHSHIFVSMVVTSIFLICIFFIGLSCWKLLWEDLLQEKLHQHHVKITNKTSQSEECNKKKLFMRKKLIRSHSHCRIQLYTESWFE